MHLNQFCRSWRSTGKFGLDLCTLSLLSPSFYVMTDGNRHGFLVVFNLSLFEIHIPQGETNGSSRSLLFDIQDKKNPGGSRPRLFTVGRLDVATSGLLLITNDGK